MRQPPLSSPTASAPAVSTSQAAPTRPMRPRTAKVELDFYPRPPRGGRRRGYDEIQTVNLFLSTPSARRATGQKSCDLQRCRISIHALREEGDGAQAGQAHDGAHFYPRPPRGGRHTLPSRRPHTAHISIHALREEGDGEIHVVAFGQVIFLSTPSARRATTAAILDSISAEFLSTPSARRATQWYINFANKRLISIHALREEGDQTVQKVRFYRSVFLSTPSARRATLSLGVAVDDQIISIHALREEGDGILPLLVYCHIPFLSTPSVRRTTV